MNEKVLKVLEYNKIIEMLVAQANSDPGRKVCSQLLPMTDMNDITKAQTQTADAIARIFQKGSTSFGSNTDVSGYASPSRFPPWHRTGQPARSARCRQSRGGYES